MIKVGNKVQRNSKWRHFPWNLGSKDVRVTRVDSSPTITMIEVEGAPDHWWDAKYFTVVREARSIRPEFFKDTPFSPDPALAPGWLRDDIKKASERAAGLWPRDPHAPKFEAPENPMPAPDYSDIEKRVEEAFRHISSAYWTLTKISRKLRQNRTDIPQTDQSRDPRICPHTGMPED